MQSEVAYNIVYFLQILREILYVTIGVKKFLRLSESKDIAFISKFLWKLFENLQPTRKTVFQHSCFFYCLFDRFGFVTCSVSVFHKAPAFPRTALAKICSFDKSSTKFANE